MTAATTARDDYWLLDYDDQFQIRSAAIYFARQGYTARLDYEKDLFIRGRTGKKLRNDLKKLFKRNKGASKNPITPSMV